MYTLKGVKNGHCPRPMMRVTRYGLGLAEYSDIVVSVRLVRTPYFHRLLCRVTVIDSRYAICLSCLFVCPVMAVETRREKWSRVLLRRRSLALLELALRVTH